MTGPVVRGAEGAVVVWFKRDLRVDDHPALAAACAEGRPLVALYVFEPELLAQPESDRAQWGFVLESLRELDGALRQCGSMLVVRHGELVSVLQHLQGELAPCGGIGALFSHEETGNRVTYDRDLRVGAWLRGCGIPWVELPQNGVVRRLRSRDGWSRNWEQRMRQALVPAPASIHPAPVAPGRLPTLEELGLPPTTIVDRQRGGCSEAQGLLHGFLHGRGETYQRAMSSPLEGWDACSRLSPHLAYGTVSVRTVLQALEARAAEVRAMPRAQKGLWPGALKSFGSRLRWHCHFVQKLEDEPRIEFENVNRAMDGLREQEFDAVRFRAFCEGRTGYPMVDACIRCLLHTGWLNFRMRAMLVSFAAYHLWLHWREVGVFLARHFVDYEPGIHWSQVQMQSGVTGINTVRIYSPRKQLRDQDPEGVFVRRWVPELARVPLELLDEPHRMTPSQQEEAGCRIGTDYPAPLVDHDEAVALAKQRVYAARRAPEARAESKRVHARHGSRKRPRRRKPVRAAQGTG
ncbi:MAG: hypothetical protein RL148_2622 [Planctomycetota bacterium]